MKELDRIAQLHYRRAFGPKPVSMPRLAEVIRDRHDDILTVDTLHETLVEAVEKALSPTEHPPNVNATYRQLGNILFLNALPDDYLPRYGKDPGKRYSKVMALIEPLTPNMSARTRRRVISQVRERMADYLLNGVDQQLEDETSTAPSRTYINRPALETAISKALKDRGRPVVLWGPSGNGKSTLARHLTGRMPEHSVVVLQGPVIPGAEFEEDLNKALHHYGIRRDSQLLGEKLRALASTHASASELSVILLDNVTPGSVDAASLAQCGAAVLITSRERFPQSGHELIRIGEYQPEESTAAAEAITGSSSTDKVERLLRLLGRRPLAVNIACRLLAETEVSIDELLSACADDAGEALEAGSVLLDDSPTPAIKAVYHELMRVLQPDRLALAVLKVILWVWDGVPVAYIGRLAQELYDVPGEDFRVLAAIERLKVLGLIQQRIDLLEINDLSLDILRSILPGDADILLKVYRLALDHAESGIDESVLWDDWPTLAYWVHTYRVSYEQVNFATGTCDFGAIALSSVQGLVWQRNNELFRADSPGIAVALADYRFDKIRLYYKGRLREPVSETILEAIMVLADQFNPTMCLGRDWPAPLSLTAEAEADTDTSIRHIRFSMVPQRRDRSQLAWSWCGALFWSTPDLLSNTFPQCEECKWALLNPRHIADRFLELSFYWELEREASKPRRPQVAELIIGALLEVLYSCDSEEDVEIGKRAITELALLIDYNGIGNLPFADCLKQVRDRFASGDGSDELLDLLLSIRWGSGRGF